jgi:GTP-binding protein
MTRQINFYNIDEKLYFVDLPGYGYASVSKTEKISWGDVIETYLSTRLTLKLVVLLVDIRHEPSKDDKLMHEWILHHNVPYIVVATKSDKISRSQINLRLKEISKSLDLKPPAQLLPYSSENKQGKDELLDVMESYIK